MNYLARQVHGLAILRFCDSSKEYPLGVSATGRRQRNRRVIRLWATLRNDDTRLTDFNSKHEHVHDFNNGMYDSIYFLSALYIF